MPSNMGYSNSMGISKKLKEKKLKKSLQLARIESPSLKESSDTILDKTTKPDYKKKYKSIPKMKMREE